MVSHCRRTRSSITEAAGMLAIGRSFRPVVSPRHKFGRSKRAPTGSRGGAPPGWGEGAVGARLQRHSTQQTPGAQPTSRTEAQREGATLARLVRRQLAAQKYSLSTHDTCGCDRQTGGPFACGRWRKRILLARERSTNRSGGEPSAASRPCLRLAGSRRRQQSSVWYNALPELMALADGRLMSRDRAVWSRTRVFIHAPILTPAGSRCRPIGGRWVTPVGGERRAVSASSSERAEIIMSGARHLFKTTNRLSRPFLSADLPTLM